MILNVLLMYLFWFQGVVDGMTGIVTKPVQGAKEEGAKGFFKGTVFIFTYVKNIVN